MLPGTLVTDDDTARSEGWDRVTDANFVIGDRKLIGWKFLPVDI
jgi:hypothetical protein